MTDRIDISIGASFTGASGTGAAVSAIQKSATAFTQLTAEEQKASTAALKTAQDYARLAAAMNEPAAAAQALKASFEASTGASEKQGIAVQQQIARLEQQAQKLQSGAGVAQQFGDAMKSSFMAIVGPAAIAAGAIRLVGEAGELIKLGTQADAARGSFDHLAVSIHTTGDALLSGLRKAAAGTVSDAQLIQSANAGILLTSGKLATDLPRLLQIARASAQATGDDVGFVFDSLVKGIARGSPQIIDNAKITLDAEGAFRTYAASIGKSVDQLTRADQQQATLNAVLAAGTDIIAKTGGAAETQATKIAQLGASWDNVKVKVGSFLGEAVAPAVQGMSDLVDGSFAASEGLAQVNTVAALLPGNFASVTAQAQADAEAHRGLASAVDATVAAAGQAAAATATHTSSMQMEIQATIEANTVFQAHTLELTNAANASIQDSAAKQEQAATTALVTAETQAAADAFIALNPNVTASGAAAAAGAAGFPPLIARLIEATLRANEARNALALFNALAGIKSSGGAMASAKASDLSDIHALKADAAAAPYRAQQAAARDAAEASRHLQSVQGNEIPTIQHLRDEAAALKKTRGEGSTDYINKLTEIEQAEKRQAANEKRGVAGGRAGGGGGSAAAKAAQATGERIEDITRVSGNKLADIEEQAQAKIAQIDAKYAAQRLKAQRALNDEIAETTAATKYDQTLNNFDQFQKDQTDAQKAAFAARETAEVHYNERVAAAQEQARAEAASGDATLAEEKLKIREAEAKKQQEIEERAAQANAETGGKQAAAVAATAKAASDAAKEQADTEIAIAEAKAKERAGAEQAEKDAVAASAKEQADKVIAAAEESATKVRKASADQRAAVIGNLQAQADAVKAWADAITSNAGRAQSAMAGVSGPPAATSGGAPDTGGDSAAAGGGVFATGGPTTLTVGDNPGGVEIVQVTPVSGRGTTRVGGSMAQMAGGGALVAGGGVQTNSSVAAAIQAGLATFGDAEEIVKILKPFVAANRGAVKLLNDYKVTVQSAVGSLLAIQDLRERLVQPQPVLDPAVVMKLKSDTELVMNLMINLDASAIKKTGVFAKYLNTEKSAIEILTQAQDLRSSLATPTPPISPAYVLELLADANAVITILSAQFIPLKQRQVDDLKLYADAEAASISLLNGVADLRKKLSGDIGGAFNMDLVRALIRRSAEITRAVQIQLVPETEKQAESFKLYADAANAAFSILSGVADLRKRLSEDIGGAFDMAIVQAFARRASEITRIVQAVIVPETEESAAGFGHYADAAGSAIAILNGVADLRKRLSEDIGGPLDTKLIQRLAAEARQTEQIVAAVLVPTTEEAAGGLARYADAAGASVGIIKDVAGLRKDLVDLAGPIPEQAIKQQAIEARRITQIVLSQMIPASEDQAAAARRYADTEGAAVEALKNVLDLPAQAFLDYRSPSDAQISMVVKDANRIVRQVDAAARVYSTEGLGAAKAFGEATGGILAAFKDQLIFSETLANGDFGIDPKNMAKFEQGMAQTLAVASRLGAQAIAIPPANIAALQNTTAALNASYDSLIKLASVPFGNVGAAAANYGGGSATINIAAGAIQISTLPGQNTSQIADMVMQRIGQRVGARR